MNPENELPYLKAFGNSIMSEISRVKATKSDVAKTTFIASISHELRSPLHGILGSVEFLHETAVSAYQAGLFTSIETCGKTLLDTIDHVLDYAKINKLRKGSAGKRRGYSKQGQKKDQLGSIVGLTAEFDLSSLVEEVVDAVTAGHVFRRNHPNTVNDHSVGSAAVAVAKATGSRALLDPVVILDVKPYTNWYVRTQPGALRRIVMNLLGNALKYTDFGFVTVSLQVESETEHHIKVRMRFTDSGRGMSLEFQRTRLFSAFSQEDPFATGTGLGLSIVRQIVEGLDGVISVSSTQHVGTEVDVVLTLPTVDPKPGKQASALIGGCNKDTTIFIVDPEEVASHAGMKLQEADARGLRQLEAALRSSCQEWFGAKVIEESEQNHGVQAASPNSQAPDYVLFPLAPPSAEAIEDYYHKVLGPAASAPMIILCSNTAQASDFRSNFADRLLDNGIQSIPVTQPLGPRKLTNIIDKFKEDQARHKQRIVLGRKESDPESIRRERDFIRKAQKAQRREASPGGKRSPSPAPPDATSTPELVRPGPSALINVESAADTVDDVPEASPTQGLAVVRFTEQANAQRSMSAPPLRIGPTLNAPSTSQPAPPRINILLVDDNNINLQLLVMFMKKQNMPYATASNGLEALETYKAGCPSAHWAYPPFHNKKQSPSTSASESEGTNTTSNGTAATVTSRSVDSLALPPRQLSLSHKRPPPFTHILMDLSMPVMDGVTSTRKIRALEAEMGIEPPSTIIALTGLASAEAQDGALSAGINEFLIKPVKFGELKVLLKDSPSA